MSDKELKATIFDIQRNSFVDGPGMRTTVFFKGCNMRCAWCHNPESQCTEKQIMFFENRCAKCGKCKELCPNSLERCDLCGKCVTICPNEARMATGKTYTVDEVMREVIKDKTFYEASGGGVTFSGGECMLSIDFLEEALRVCRSSGIHTAIDTAGNVPYEYFERVLPFTDIFLYDVKMLDSARQKSYTGVDNSLILANLASLLECGSQVIVRIPLIAGVNDTEEEIKSIKDFIDLHGGARSELLPYHSMGEHKYAALGRASEHFSAPSEERIERLKCIVN